jgi:hypothetical protein
VGALAALVGALVAPHGANNKTSAAAEVASAVNASAASSVEVPAPRLWIPLEYGLLRLLLPPGWAAVSLCTPVASTARGSGEFVNVGGSTFELSTDEFLLRPGAYQPTSCAPPRSGGWAAVKPLAGAAPRGWRPSTLNRTQVWAPVQQAPEHETLAVPLLHMELVAVGRGREVVGPSARPRSQYSSKRAVPLPCRDLGRRCASTVSRRESPRTGGSRS